MLDYAANGLAFWTPTQLRGCFEGYDPDGATERLVAMLIRIGGGTGLSYPLHYHFRRLGLYTITLLRRAVPLGQPARDHPALEIWIKRICRLSSYNCAED